MPWEFCGRFPRGVFSNKCPFPASSIGLKKKFSRAGRLVRVAPRQRPRDASPMRISEAFPALGVAQAIFKRRVAQRIRSCVHGRRVKQGCPHRPVSSFSRTAKNDAAKKWDPCNGISCSIITFSNVQKCKPTQIPNEFLPRLVLIASVRPCRQLYVFVFSSSKHLQSCVPIVVNRKN